VNAAGTSRLLDELLVDPETREPVARATQDQLEALAWALREGRARRRSGALPAKVDGAYLSHGNRWVYPDVDGIRSLLIDERIELDAPL
jgi:uncharacterized protein YbaR (Trm112 family)